LRLMDGLALMTPTHGTRTRRTSSPAARTRPR
jgi:hypothetical protein